MKKTVLRRISFAAVIAALYVALTLACGPMAFSGFINLRPSEALTALPAIFPEAIFGLYFGCLLSNLFSSFGIFDIILGSLVTLVSAFLTRMVKNLYIGGIFPVLFNATFLPLIWILAGGQDVVYWFQFLSILTTQSIWYYALGVPICLGLKKVMKDKLY